METAIYLALGAITLIAIGAAVCYGFSKTIDFDLNNNYEKIGGIN